MNPESITLYYKAGSSDKVYTVELINHADLVPGWEVGFAYGRRGSSMTTGLKAKGVPHATAKRIYDQLVREKMAKGYAPGADSTPYQRTSSEMRTSGINVQLLNECSEDDVKRLINDANWGAQEKVDGRRQVIRKIGDTIEGINRKGLVVPISDAVRESALVIDWDFVIDGESVGDMFYAFDALQMEGISLCLKDYSFRHNRLSAHDAIQIVPLAKTTAEKRALYNHLLNVNAEGIVFKRLAAPYTSGRPNTGGDALKFKFYATGSFIVAAHNLQRSVQLHVLGEHDQMVNVGRCTIPPNHGIPKIGAIIEVRYLYAYSGGSLYQPVYLGVRDDIVVEECTLEQLKFKSEDEDEA